MKRPIRNIFLFLIIYYGISFGLTALYVILSKKSVEVLSSFSRQYLLDSVLLTFISLLPTLQISGLIVPFSWFFRDMLEFTRDRILRGIFFIILLCMGILIVATELVAPLLRARMERAETATVDFYDLMDLAGKSLERNQYTVATSYLQQALLISPGAEQALSLKRSLEDRYPYYTSKSPPLISDGNYGMENRTGLTYGQLLQKARDSYTSGSYIDAHYYANLALADGKASEYSVQDARQIAADAWNKLSQNETAQKEDHNLYARKKEGYVEILNGNYLSAYYLFNQLYKEFKTDPDIVRYFLLSKDKLKNQYFFIDETYNLQPFEKVRNLRFSFTNPDGSLDLVTISGLTGVKDSGGLIQYARGLQLVRFDSEKKLIFVMSTNYAKIVAITSEDLDSGSDRDAGKNARKKEVYPFIQLVSVDRNTEGVIHEPVFEFAAEGMEPQSSYAMNIPYKDFLLLSEAARGPENISLLTLWQFSGKAAQYGHSPEVYYQVLYRRLCFPLLLLILTILTVICAWTFRIKAGQTIKFRWLFYIPLFSAATFFLLEIILYYFSLFMYTLIGLFHAGALPAMIFVLVLLFALLSVVFAVQSNE